MGAIGSLLSDRDVAQQSSSVNSSDLSEASDVAQPAPIDLQDTAEYFHPEKMHSLIGTNDLKKPKCEVMAYNFPSWHPDPYMESLFGRGWTEYELLKRSKPLFPGHQMPRYPLLGYYNEALPAVAEQEIELASSYGITGWMIDWYWHNGKQFLQQQLEQGLLQAGNRNKLKFAIMWANHDWKNVFPAPSEGRAAMLLPQRHSIEDCERVTSYCCEHYFRQPNYWRLNGNPVFAIFNLPKLVSELGQTGASRALEVMRKRAQAEGVGELHLQASHMYEPAMVNSLGFDSATMYHAFAYTYSPNEITGPRAPYGRGAAQTINAWKMRRKQLKVPFFPDCPVGWDDSSRYGTSSKIVYERTPDQFEQLCRAGRHFSAENESSVCFLSSWNEWSEDHVLLPDTYFGYSYLSAVRQAFS